MPHFQTSRPSDYSQALQTSEEQRYLETRCGYFCDTDTAAAIFFRRVPPVLKILDLVVLIRLKLSVRRLLEMWFLTAFFDSIADLALVRGLAVVLLNDVD